VLLGGSQDYEGWTKLTHLRELKRRARTNLANFAIRINPAKFMREMCNMRLIPLFTLKCCFSDKVTNLLQ
jgi:hypothetical protein